jgi:TonB family protein
VYPEAALLQGLTGSVELELEIDAEGVVLAARVLAGSIDAVFDQAALDAAWATRFIPARRNGVPVASTLRPVMVFDAAMPLQAALDR